MKTDSLAAGRDSVLRERPATGGAPPLTLAFDWTSIGTVSLDAEGRLVFPRAPSSPGLYQFALEHNALRIFYTGQADNLARRFQHYRTPGPSQQTNIRLNGRMTRTLTTGGRIAVSTIVHGTTIAIGGITRAIDFDSKAERVLLEQAAIAVASETGATSLNK